MFAMSLKEVRLLAVIVLVLSVGGLVRALRPAANSDALTCDAVGSQDLPVESASFRTGQTVSNKKFSVKTNESK